MPSPLEMGFIIVIVIVVLFITRVSRTGRGASSQKRTQNRPTTSPPKKDKTATWLNRSGIILVIIGIIALAAAAGLFEWVSKEYLIAIIVILAGIILVVISRRRR
jgi:hypothetical protein